MAVPVEERSIAPPVLDAVLVAKLPVIVVRRMLMFAPQSRTLCRQQFRRPCQPSRC